MILRKKMWALLVLGKIPPLAPREPLPRQGGGPEGLGVPLGKSNVLVF